MAPPAKRRKRNVIPTSSPSDEEDGEPVMRPKNTRNALISSSPPSRNDSKSSATASTQSTNPTKSQSHPKTATFPHNAAPIHLPKAHGSKASSKSASSSPEKKKGKGKAEDKFKSGNLFTFFTKQAQRQQAEGGASTTAPKPKLSSQRSKSVEIEDEDIISDEDWTGGKAQLSSMVGQAARKRSRGTDALKNGDGDAPPMTQKFLKPRPLMEIKHGDDLRPWAERFGPANLDELAVHKKKVADVRGWLDEVMHGRLRQRLLVLKGAAGTGKTTTVQLLAKAMNCEVLEWRNPVGSVATSDGFQSMAAQFEEFMGRGGKFGQLDIFSANELKSSKPQAKPLDRRKQLILVEEFPNTFTRSSTALQSFRSAIIQYLASNTPPLSMIYDNKTNVPVTPVVMIVSETLLTTTSASADSFTAHRLLGPEILQHPGVGIIEFNAIAPTLLAKGLEVIVQKESRKSGRRKTPGPLVLKQLGEIGDIRSAIGSLEFLCLRGDSNGDWGAKVAFGKVKKAAKDTALTKMEEESLELVTRREASLGIFHAVGKVVYNKRQEVGTQTVENLDDHMSLYSRPKKSEVHVDELIDETGTDTQTFIAALHENYIPSCNASPTSFDFSSLDHVNGCIDALSDSDLLCPSWDGSFKSSGFGGGTGRGTGGDILRLDEMSFQLAVRGILFSLPNPVKRTATAAAGLRTSKKGDEYKMFYPTSLKLWRMKEEIESTIDLWVTRMMKGEDQNLSGITAVAAAFARPALGTVESWKNAHHSPKEPISKEVGAAPLIAVGTSARKEMLLERLPYMVQIARARKVGSSMLAVKDMEKVTSFHGISGPTDVDQDDDDDNPAVGEEWATDKPVEGKSPRKKGLAIRGRGMASGLPLQQLEQKLVLSDDDIED
ncbi:Cell cycle checkpoint rad17 [Hyphodiscus hymeniophilus]|uniref:Cell cycle checkpoint rad17 n=1 Tax=Hyphodiscus hymeniophilus TaxID=353542 RepID=A0A9P7AWD4_9HELO|nr:Cell cycle checkpoint rad17 [Hyphodiscus hymeniophilus]